MKKQALSLLLALILCLSAFPAVYAAGSGDMLTNIAYYGDRSKCVMSAEQAQAFVAQIEVELAKRISGLEEPGVGYAALFDLGNGVPALLFAQGYRYISSDYGTENYFIGYSSVWTWENGELVQAFNEWSGSVLLYRKCIERSGGDWRYEGITNEVYPFSNGTLAKTPLYTSRGYSVEVNGYQDWAEEHKIEGKPATKVQIDALAEQWLGGETALAHICVDGGPGFFISGLTPVTEARPALLAYVTAVRNATLVRLQLNGGSGGSGLWTGADGRIRVPTNPTRPGYTFGGWYSDADFTTPWNFNAAVSGPLTLYAKWVPVSSTAASAGRSQHRISIDGVPVNGVEGYTLRAANGGDVTYVKLRDLAAVLDGTAAQFNVDWRDEAIYVERGKPYTTRNGKELQPIEGTDGSYRWNTAPVLFDGETRTMEGIVLEGKGGGHTFFKLRDLADALGFTVGWTQADGIVITTK